MALKASAGVVNTGQRSTSFLSHDRRGGYRGRILASCSVLPPTWHRFLAPVAPVRKGASAAATRRRGGVVCRAAASGESETLIGDALAFLENRFPQLHALLGEAGDLQRGLLQVRDAALSTEDFQNAIGRINSQLLALVPKAQTGLNGPTDIEGASLPDLQAAVNNAIGAALMSDQNAVFSAWLAASALVAAAGGLYLFDIQNAQEAIPQQYDLKKLNEYWSRRPLAAARRSASVTLKILGWLARLLVDVQGREEGIAKGAPARAKELKEIISSQGPAFVKVGQAVAIRPDLLPPAYMEQLQELLDQVQPFGQEEAQALLEAEMGRPLTEVFSDASTAFDRPVASASIGQVYKARLRAAFSPTGEPVTVAVKCQRPNILESVTLDILTMRGIASFLGKLPGDNAQVQQMRTNAEGFIAVIDVAAARFLEEMDYVQEMANAKRFEEEMCAVEFVRGMIKVPKVFPNVSSRYVMVTEWVDGRKLTELAGDNSPEGKALKRDTVTKLLNSYMVQFLETGFLHADPHPGNFLMLPDGRLCIMDYGMMTEISEDQRVAFVEYLAHLSARQYNETLDDLVRLGFVPKELGEDPEKRAIVGPVLAETLETIYSTGGGMDGKIGKLQENQKTKTAALSEKLEEIGREYPLQLPPYFVLILRAFGTLEGLGLSVDENFAVVDECFPYIARRLLSDNNPRIRESLRTFIYNGENRLDVEKLEDVAKGFSSFTNTMDASALARGDGSTRQLDAATRDLVSLLFSPEGNYLQDLLIDEAVRAVDALSRDSLVRLWKRLAASAPAAVAVSLLPTPLGPPAALVPGFNAVPLLSIVASQRTDAIAMTAEDEANLTTLRRLAGLFATMSNAAQQQSAVGASQDPSQARVWAQLTQSQEQTQQLLQLTSPGAASIAQRFAQRLFQRLQHRFREDIQSLGFSGLIQS